MKTIIMEVDMLPTLDFDDMVKTGQAEPRPENIKNGDRKYAVIIKNAHSCIGKFDITDKPSVEESVHALNVNKDIPDVVYKSAAYYTKLAADYHNVPFDVIPDPAPHTIIISDIIVKSAEFDDVPMLSFGGKKFILSDEEQIKRAEDYFILKGYLMKAAHRINVSRIIVKAAAFKDYIPKKETIAYARSEYGDVRGILEKKASISNNSDYSAVMSALSKCYSSIPVHEFLDMVETCDKRASLKHERCGIYTHDLLMPPTHKSVAEEVIKNARINSDSIMDLV